MFQSLSLFTAIYYIGPTPWPSVSWHKCFNHVAHRTVEYWIPYKGLLCVGTHVVASIPENTRRLSNVSDNYSANAKNGSTFISQQFGQQNALCFESILDKDDWGDRNPPTSEMELAPHLSGSNSLYTSDVIEGWRIAWLLVRDLIACLSCLSMYRVSPFIEACIYNNIYRRPLCSIYGWWMWYIGRHTAHDDAWKQYTKATLQTPQPRWRAAVKAPVGSHQPWLWV